MMGRGLHIAVFVLVGLALRAQDPQLSQFYAAPMYLNPALTGNTNFARASLNYRSQWHGVSTGFDTYAMNFDMNLRESNGAVGLSVMHDVAGPHALSFTKAAFNYAWAGRIDQDKTIRLGGSMAVTTRSYDPSSFLFADQIVRDDPVTIETLRSSRVIYPDMAAGAVYSNKRWWMGVSFKHLNRPIQTLLPDGDYRLPTHGSIQVGYRNNQDYEKELEKKPIITVATQYKFQGAWDQLDLGTYLQLNRVIFGLWYRGLPLLKPDPSGPFNRDAMVAMVGVKTNNNWQISYSYDATISELGLRSGGANEIAIIYEWGRKKGRKHKAVPCPLF